MTNDKYVRVSNTLYEEHSPTGGRPLKWPKALESLYLELFDAQAVEGSSFAGMPPLGSVGITVKESELRPIKQIRATGKMQDQRDIGFISETGLSDRGHFTEMSVTIKGTSDELLEEIARNGVHTASRHARRRQARPFQVGESGSDVSVILAATAPCPYP